MFCDIERPVRESIGRELPEPQGEMTVRQRRVIPLALTVRSVVTLYPRRTVLGLALFVGQAFLYNSILFGLSDLLSIYFKVATGDVPYYLVVFAVGNVFAPRVLGRLLDTVGRKPMMAGTYLLSGVLLIITALLFQGHGLSATSLAVALTITFFFASAGVSAAYLTVSEIFPMETRALCISVAYAVGTGLGGIIGPLLSSHLVKTGDFSQAAIRFIIGAVMMIIGGIVELIYGIKAEGRALEDIAQPLTAADADASGGRPGAPSPAPA